MQGEGFTAVVATQVRHESRVPATSTSVDPTVDFTSGSAVNRLGLDVLRGFRMKAFILIAVQSVTTLVIAATVEFGVSAARPRRWINAAFGALCSLTVVALVGVAIVRHRYPWNYIGELIFTIFLGTTFGFMTDPLHLAEERYAHSSAGVARPQVYFLAFYTAGLIIIALLSLAQFPGSKRMMKCLPCAGIAVVLVDTFMVTVWALVDFCPLQWLLLMMFVVTCTLLWVGIENDRLAAKLNPDEYLLPVILIWADLFMIFAGALVVCFCAQELCCQAIEVATGSPCICDGGGWCDCWLYGRPATSPSQVVPADALGHPLGHERLPEDVAETLQSPSHMQQQMQ